MVVCRPRAPIRQLYPPAVVQLCLRESFLNIILLPASPSQGKNLSNFCDKLLSKVFNLTIKRCAPGWFALEGLCQSEGSLPSLLCPILLRKWQQQNLVCLFLHCDFRILESTKIQDGSFNVIIHLDVGFKKIMIHLAYIVDNVSFL